MAVILRYFTDFGSFGANCVEDPYFGTKFSAKNL